MNINTRLSQVRSDSFQSLSLLHTVSHHEQFSELFVLYINPRTSYVHLRTFLPGNITSRLCNKKFCPLCTALLFPGRSQATSQPQQNLAENLQLSFTIFSQMSVGTWLSNCLHLGLLTHNTPTQINFNHFLPFMKLIHMRKYLTWNRWTQRKPSGMMIFRLKLLKKHF